MKLKKGAPKRNQNAKNENPKTIQIAFRVSLEEKESIQDMAKQQGFDTVSAFSRSVILSQVDDYK